MMYPWEDPATGAGRDKSRDAWNKKCINLVTLHAGDDDPPTKWEYMLQVRTDTNRVQQLNAAKNTWHEIGRIGEVNWGLVDKYAPVLETDLDFNGHAIKDPEWGGGGTGSPGTPDETLLAYKGATPYYVPAYLSPP